MKLRLSRLPEGKRFNYTSRYYEGKEEGSTFGMGSRIHKDRETVSNHLTEQRCSIHSESKNKKNAQSNKTF